MDSRKSCATARIMKSTPTPRQNVNPIGDCAPTWHTGWCLCWCHRVMPLRWSRFDELQTDINAFPEKFTPFRHSELSAVIEFYFAPSSSPWLGKQLNHILQSKFGGKLQPVKYFPSFIHGKISEECQISAGRWQKAHAENGADLMLIEFCWAATLFLFMGNCYHRLESPKVHRIHLEVQNEHCLAW